MSEFVMNLLEDEDLINWSKVMDWRMSEPFLSSGVVLNPCFLCGKDCMKKNSVKFPSIKGWKKFIDIALRWYSVRWWFVLFQEYLR